MLNKVPDSYIQELRFYLHDYTWDQFMNTTKKYSKIKKQTRYIKLNTTYSELYYKSEDFRQIINSKIINTNKQLLLNLKKYNFENNIIKDIFNINQLNLYFLNISNIYNFRNIKKLDLTGCSNVVDISCLNNIEEINLSYLYNLKNISSLKNAKKVILSHCYYLEDITPLVNVETIFISNCDSIIDVSILKNAKILYLTLCKGIKYVESLYSVNKLFIHLCYNVIDICKLKEKKKNNLSIYFCQ